MIGFLLPRSGLVQLINKRYADGTSESYSYDANGRLKTAVNGNIGYTYDYYPNGRLQRVNDSSGGQITNDLYDNLGQRKRITVKDGADQRVISYTYDEANRPKTITSGAGQFTYSYDKQGRRSSTGYPNGISATFAYDDLDRLTSLTHAAGATTIAFANYTDFDKVGNRKAKTSTASGAEQYLYDLVYRVTTVTNPAKPETFVYDDVGNRTQGSGPKDTAYQYNAGNQMMQGRKLQYGYDNAGNQTAKIIPNATDKTWMQTWDLENRLVKVEKIKGAEKRIVTFKYDPFGRRIEKKLTTVIDGITKVSTWAYVYDNDNIAVEIYADEAGNMEKTFYTHGVGVDEHLALERNGSYFYYHADGLGSITSITDTHKTVVQSYEYDSFGMLKPSTSFPNSFTWTGREWDKETGLYYYRARYYDPMEGRFIQKDPIGFEGGDMNLYGYVGNSPLNRTDPTGLKWVWFCKARLGSGGSARNTVAAVYPFFGHCYIKFGDDARGFYAGATEGNWAAMQEEERTPIINRWCRPSWVSDCVYDCLKKNTTVGTLGAPYGGSSLSNNCCTNLNTKVKECTEKCCGK